MDESIVWTLAVLSFIAFLKTLLDAFNKTVEAETEHAEHYGKPKPAAQKDGTWSRKDKVDYASFLLGFAASFGGLIFAFIKAGGGAAGWAVGGMGIIVAILGVAWAAHYYLKTGKTSTV